MSEEHLSSPNGCHPDCPACKSKDKKPVIESGFDDVERNLHETQSCCMTLCEWEAITQRDERHLCAQCAEAFDAGALDTQPEVETEEEALTNELIAVIWPRLDAGSSKDDITDAVNNVFDAYLFGVRCWIGTSK